MFEMFPFLINNLLGNNYNNNVANNNSFNKKKGDYISVEFNNIEDQKNRDIVSIYRHTEIL